MALPKRRTSEFAVCIKNQGYAASLEVRKLYPVLEDANAEAERLVRIIDESGEDYLYPEEFFRRVSLPAEVQQALRVAS
jgi:hypothetical protein